MRGKLFLLSKCFKKKKKRASQWTNGKNSARANMACVQKKKKSVCLCVPVRFAGRLSVE